ncbi:MAG: arylamine N-acetyltransferase [Burkholderiales bacterium]|nr:arylamine N-acetyltransferase [Burkholderiales bacterium]
MSTTPFDLDGYRARIGWQERSQPDLATLTAVLRAHMRAIPFENIDVLLGREVALDLAALQAKLVQAKRGGYCFEHATLFKAVLESLGFAPVPHLARVITYVPRQVASRAHMFLAVPLPEGPCVVDPGFGGLAAGVPLPLVEGLRTSDGVQTHWFTRDDRHWVLHADVDGRAQECWVSTLEHDNPIDFEMGNHFTATYPGSPFRQRLMLRALTPGGRISVMNRDVTVREGDHFEQHVLADRHALRVLVARHFGFDLPQIERLRVPAVPEWS